jgi:transcriptional regulator with XRE-family HTH domain
LGVRGRKLIMVSLNTSLTLGELIKEARKRLNLSQTDLAKSLNVTKGAVSAWEQNRSAPNRHRAPKVSRVLKIQTAWISEPALALSWFNGPGLAVFSDSQLRCHATDAIVSHSENRDGLLTQAVAWLNKIEAALLQAHRAFRKLAQ